MEEGSHQLRIQIETGDISEDDTMEPTTPDRTEYVS